MGDNSITCVLVHMCSMSVFQISMKLCVGFPSKYLRGGEEWEKVDKLIDKKH